MKFPRTKPPNHGTKPQPMTERERVARDKVLESVRAASIEFGVRGNPESAYWNIITDAAISAYKASQKEQGLKEGAD
jgi:hypothetical protein